MNHRFYTHALATIAICELLGMTRDESLREPGQTGASTIWSRRRMPWAAGGTRRAAVRTCR